MLEIMKAASIARSRESTAHLGVTSPARCRWPALPVRPALAASRVHGNSACRSHVTNRAETGARGAGAASTGAQRISLRDAQSSRYTYHRDVELIREKSLTTPKANDKAERPVGAPWGVTMRVSIRAPLCARGEARSGRP